MADAIYDASKVADATKTIVKDGDNILDTADVAKDLKKASNIADEGKDSSKALTQAKNIFPNNTDDLLPEIPRNKVVKSNGITSQTKLYNAKIIKIKFINYYKIIDDCSIGKEIGYFEINQFSNLIQQIISEEIESGALRKYMNELGINHFILFESWERKNNWSRI